MTTPTDLHRALAEVAFNASMAHCHSAKFGDREPEGELEAIAQALAEKMPGWMPIETAPKDAATALLLWFPFMPGLEKRGCAFVGIWSDAGDYELEPCWRDPGDLDTLGEPSHWQPLPPPPESP